MEIQIRKAEINDVDAIVDLSKELGYNPTMDEIKNKLKKYDLTNVDEVFVADYGEVVGWIHVSIVEPLESKVFAEIRGVVVNEKFRKRGIGKKLIEAAERWAKDNNCNRIRVRTNIIREETRKYYYNLKFISKKTQEVFEKEI